MRQLISSNPVQKILHEFPALGGQDRLGVDLDTLDVVFPMADAHDDAVLRLGGDGEAVGQRRALHDEGMIAPDLEGIRQPRVEARAIVTDARRFAVNDLTRAHDLAAENLAEGLCCENGGWVLAEDSAWRDVVVSLDGSEGDGFVKSNVFDLLAWDRALRNETILTKEEQAMMYTPVRLNNGEIGEISMYAYKTLTDIQWGRAKGPEGWSVEIGRE